MVSIYDVQPNKLIEEAAKELKKMPEMAPPSWAIAAKTGVHNMRPPMEEDWWYIRAAAVLRATYRLGPIGVSKLRTKYGGRKNRGYAPDKTYKAGGNILRKILQKLELIGFLKQAQVGTHKGRILTPKGKSFVDKIAVKVKEPYKKTVKHVEEKKHEEKEEKPHKEKEHKHENKEHEKKEEEHKHKKEASEKGSE